MNIQRYKALRYVKVFHKVLIWDHIDSVYSPITFLVASYTQIPQSMRALKIFLFYYLSETSDSFSSEFNYSMLIVFYAFAELPVSSRAFLIVTNCVLVPMTFSTKLFFLFVIVKSGGNTTDDALFALLIFGRYFVKIRLSCDFVKSRLEVEFFSVCELRNP